MLDIRICQLDVYKRQTFARVRGTNLLEELVLMLNANNVLLMIGRDKQVGKEYDWNTDSNDVT